MTSLPRPASLLAGLAILAGAAFAAPAFAFASATPPAPAPTPPSDALAAIEARGVLTCAVNTDEDDWSLFDTHGDVSAFATDLCRAAAAAILPSGRSTVVPAQDGITVLRDVRDGKADIALGATPDPALGAQLGLLYASPFLIDGQGFLVNRGAGIHTLSDLAGKRICFVEGSPEGEVVRTRMAELHVPIGVFPFSERGEMMGALATGHCDAVTGDVTELAAERLSLPALAADGVVLPVRLTTDPWSPALRRDDVRLLALVNAVEDGLVSADVLGIDRANAAAAAAHPADPVVARLLGDSPWRSRGLGVDQRFLLRAIEAEGNQAEIYDRDLGPHSAFRLPVGANAPVPQGGALMSIPIGGIR